MASGGRSLARDSSACLSRVLPRRHGSGRVPFPGFPSRASVAVYQPPRRSTRRSLWGRPSSATSLFLHAAACGLRRTFTSSPKRRLLCRLRRALKPAASAASVSRSCTSPLGCAVTPPACRMLCRRFTHFVRRALPTPPPWTQDSIRVGGEPFPARDLHPARYAKLSWRENATAQRRGKSVAAFDTSVCSALIILKASSFGLTEAHPYPEGGSPYPSTRRSPDAILHDSAPGFPAASTCTSTGWTAASSMPRARYAGPTTFAPIPIHFSRR